LQKRNLNLIIFMSQANCSHCGCPTPEVVEIPGSPGANGTDGVAGINAFSITQQDFTVPAVSSAVTVTVDTNAWMVVGQNVFVLGAGYFQVTSLGGTTAAGLTYLDYAGNTNAGNNIVTGAQVSPAGTQPVITSPLPIADGGTNAATADAARASLSAAELGANTDITSLTGLTSRGTFICNEATPVTVEATNLTANSVVIITLKTVGGTVGAVPAIQTVTPGTGFTVAGTAADTSDYNFIILN
jgi:hypothetical protein